MRLFKIDFFEFHLQDLFDILLVALLIFIFYRMLRGSLALNIFIGFIILYVVSFIVKGLNMRLLSSILGQFVGLGAIALLIVFQQEIRRFLLFIGQNRAVFSSSSLTGLLMPWRSKKNTESRFETLATCAKKLSFQGEGALMVLARSNELRIYSGSGTIIDANVSEKLILSIFNKKSPLHDGAIIIANNRIRSASAILPVSDSRDLPPHFGLRHRSALGITEQSDAMVITISEETGAIRVFSSGRFSSNLISSQDLPSLFYNYYYQLSEIL